MKDALIFVVGATFCAIVSVALLHGLEWLYRNWK